MLKIILVSALLISACHPNIESEMDAGNGVASVRLDGPENPDDPAWCDIFGMVFVSMSGMEEINHFVAPYCEPFTSPEYRMMCQPYVMGDVLRIPGRRLESWCESPFHSWLVTDLDQ